MREKVISSMMRSVHSRDINMQEAEEAISYLKKVRSLSQCNKDYFVAIVVIKAKIMIVTTVVTVMSECEAKGAC